MDTSLCRREVALGPPVWSVGVEFLAPTPEQIATAYTTSRPESFVHD